MTNTPNPQANTLDEQIRKAIKAYRVAGGDPEFYIISKSDHDRNWAKAVTEARIDELKKMWNNTQPDIKPEGADDTPIDPAYITDRLAQLKENK